MTHTDALRLGAVHANVITEAALGGYPDEVCGILVGRGADGQPAEVVRVVPTRNASTENRGQRYIIPPADLVHEQRAAREAGLVILGFYHSHPDHPAVPSSHDLELAWPEYVYVIVPVAAGRAGVPRAWRLAGDRSGFREIAFDVADGMTQWA